jgi:methylmalonyl-CoA/ethylmalonyl-CoA epimerase
MSTADILPERQVETGSMKLDHIGIAVYSIAAALKTYELLGFSLREIIDIEEQKVRVAVLPSGESCIELMEPTAADSPIQKFLEKRGEGIHHLCFQVENIERKIEELQANSLQLVSAASGTGLGRRNIAFLHPRSTHGALIELVEASTGRPYL